jgi:hypothetical protein
VRTHPEQVVAAAAVRRIVVPEAQVRRNLALPRRHHSSGRAHLLCLHLQITEAAAFMACACRKVSALGELYSDEIVSPTLRILCLKIREHVQNKKDSRYFDTLDESLL